MAIPLVRQSFHGKTHLIPAQRRRLLDGHTVGSARGEKGYQLNTLLVYAYSL